MLPKINTYTIPIVLSTGTYKFTRFRVADEKILLTAKQSGKDEDVLTAIKQVVKNCLDDPTLDVEKMSIFDLEYAYLKLTEASVSDVAKISIFDPEDEKKYDFDVDLKAVKLDTSKIADQNVKVTNEITVHVNFPNAALYNDPEIIDSNDIVFDLALRCIDKIYEGDSVYETKNVTKADLSKWLNDLPNDAYKKIRAVFDSAPTMTYDIKYTNSRGTERTITLSTIRDFFPF